MAKPLYDPFYHITQQMKDQIRHGENASRLAQSFGTFETTGWGEFVFEDQIKFDAPYLHRPQVGYGASLAEDELVKLRASRYPRCSHIVSDWDIDVKGFYRGAWVAVIVEDRSSWIAPVDGVDPNYHIFHDFSFLGIAMKDLLGNLNGDISER